MPQRKRTDQILRGEELRSLANHDPENIRSICGRLGMGGVYRRGGFSEDFAAINKVGSTNSRHYAHQYKPHDINQSDSQLPSILINSNSCSSHTRIILI